MQCEETKINIRNLINLGVILALALTLLVGGFVLGSWFTNNYNMEEYQTTRTCTFFHDQYKKDFALIICEDDTMWNATPYIVPARYPET